MQVLTFDSAMNVSGGLSLDDAAGLFCDYEAAEIVGGLVGGPVGMVAAGLACAGMAALRDATK
jgi:hypothetical protein